MDNMYHNRSSFASKRNRFPALHLPNTDDLKISQLNYPTFSCCNYTVKTLSKFFFYKVLIITFLENNNIYSILIHYTFRLAIKCSFGVFRFMSHILLFFHIISIYVVPFFPWLMINKYQIAIICHKTFVKHIADIKIKIQFKYNPFFLRIIN